MSAVLMCRCLWVCVSSAHVQLPVFILPNVSAQCYMCGTESMLFAWFVCFGDGCTSAICGISTTSRLANLAPRQVRVVVYLLHVVIVVTLFVTPLQQVAFSTLQQRPLYRHQAAAAAHAHLRAALVKLTA
ncbi:hypothetical protein COO60DRAFT_1239458 [Scenedesmus sp. NREL 46B-D3]|nr:hypothetical protein COO60DRAFT_1239458 [Scenedesmus sp. NREL 46B-D3]